MTQLPTPLAKAVPCRLCGRKTTHPSKVCTRHSRGGQQPTAAAIARADRKEQT